MKPETWLDDEVIDAYFNLLVEHPKNGPPYQKVFFFPTYFMVWLLNKGWLTKPGEFEYGKVCRWSKKKFVGILSIFDTTQLFIPIKVNRIVIS